LWNRKKRIDKLLRLIDSRMRQPSTVINDGAKVAKINPSPALGTSNVAVRCVYTGTALPLVEILAARNRPHRKASLIAGWSGFLIFIQIGRSTSKRIDPRLLQRNTSDRHAGLAVAG
jgi:hypothetical protein